MKAILGFVSIDFRGYKLYKRAFGGGGGWVGGGAGGIKIFLCWSPMLFVSRKMQTFLDK